MKSFEEVIQDVLAEAARGHTLHSNYNSMHEAYAVLLEEVDEFWDEVRKKRGERNLPRVREELIQIAAVAVRAAAVLPDR